MLVFLLVLLIQVALAHVSMPNASDVEFAGKDDHSQVAKRQPRNIRLPFDLDYFPAAKKRIKPKANYRYIEKKFILRPSSEVLFVKFLEVFGKTPVVVKITFHGNVIYDGTKNILTLSKPDFEPLHRTESHTKHTEFDRKFSPFFSKLKNQSLRFKLLSGKGRKEQCGTVKTKDVPLIAYGTSTSEGERPWHAVVYKYLRANMIYLCAGSLISRKHIITAGHCVTLPKTNTTLRQERLHVVLGKQNLFKQDKNVQDRRVNRITLHPNYESIHLSNDIAILHLDLDVEITDFVRYVCLWEEDTSLDSIVDRFGTIVGWGLNKTSGYISDKLLQTVMPVVSTETCLRNNVYFWQFTSKNIFCAKTNDIAPCIGDPGGGMVFPRPGLDNSLIWQLRGVISDGVMGHGTRSYCKHMNYIVFTDVANYLDWIQSIIQ